MWTPEKIVESFPITLESCRKLLKSKWAPKTMDQLAEHDRKAMENWRLLSKYNQIEPGKFIFDATKWEGILSSSCLSSPD